jgi:hypothetical protein
LTAIFGAKQGKSLVRHGYNPFFGALAYAPTR